MQVIESQRLKGRVTIVTGGARGVGAETVRLFQAHGARVVIVDLREEEGRALAAQLGDRVCFCPGDVSKPGDWVRVVEAAHTFGPVSVLVNNAAALEIETLAHTDVQVFERLFRINQLGPFLGIKAVMDDMIAARSGSIINIGSVDGVVAQDIGLSAYGATKWAVRGLTKMAALELGRYGVRVNCVNPDGGNPQMSAPFLGDLDMEEAMTAHVHQILEPPKGMPRNKRMRDIANMILFLASDEGIGCTGGDFPVDGGYSAGRRFVP